VGATNSGRALLAIALLVTGCPRVDAFACGDGVARCDLHENGACVDGWCAYPDTVCESGSRWHGDAPGVGGTCVPVDGGTEPASSTGPSPPGSSSSSSSSGGDSSTGAIPSCGEALALEVDTMALAGTEVLEGYPLLVALEDPAIVGVTAAGFTDLAGAPLPFELEALDAEAGNVRAWVVLPSWTPGEPLQLRLLVGDPDVVPSEDPTAVWPEGFVGVWHLDDALTGGARDLQLDSSMHENHGLVLGGMTAEQIVAGTVGGGIAFDGVDDEVQLAGASFVGALASSTISIWARVDADGSVENPFFSRMNGDNLYPRCRTRPDTDGAVQCQTQVADVPLAIRADAKLVPRGEWHHVAITFEAETGRFALYANGALVDEGMLAAEPQDGGDEVPEIGRIAEFGYLLGVLDELRVIDRPLPEAWIAADERSQRDPGAITRIVGAPRPTPCP
jgi:hypothetical protein